GAQPFVGDSDHASGQPASHGRNLSNIVIFAYRRLSRGRSILGALEDEMRNSPSAALSVTEVPAAEPEAAAAHFERLLAFETDCWDVHAAIEAGEVPFTILDVRAPEAFAAGHVPGSIKLPHRANHQPKSLTIFSHSPSFC